MNRDSDGEKSGIQDRGTAQLRAELEVGECRPRLHPVRSDDGRREVDLLAELGGGRVIGLEVEASAVPPAVDAEHLEWSARSLGDRFVAGIVLHTGRRVFRLGERVTAIPISAPRS